MSSSNVEYSEYPFLSINITPTKLCFNYPKNNYQAWKQQMLFLIERRGLLGFIDGSISPPENIIMKQEHVAWRRDDVLVKGWILCSLNDDVVSSVANLRTARQVWLELEKMFDQPSPDVRGAPSPTSADWNHKNYVQLHRAALDGDWNEVKRIFEYDPHAMKAGLDVFESTALHVAIGADENTIQLVKNMVNFLSDEDIAQVTLRGNTALSIAAAVGNIETAIVLVERMPSLLYMSNYDGDFPVQIAAKHRHKLMLDYLISVTMEDYIGQKPYYDLTGLRLLLYVIDAEFFDFALCLVHKYPYLAKLKLNNNTSALTKLAENKSVFSKEQIHENINSKEDVILLFLSMANKFKQQNPTSNTAGDIESTTINASQASGGFHTLLVCLWKIIEKIDLRTTKRVTEKLKAANKAKKVVVSLCNEIQSLSSEEAFGIYSHAILKAVQHGTTEVVEVIVKRFPSAIYTSVNGQFIMHIAIQNRSSIDLIYKMSYQNHLYSDTVDSNGNNILHLASKLAPPHRLNEISGPIFQMQSELQWYKEVENLVHPDMKKQLNNEGKTPMMVFTEEHKNLKEEAQRWMKDAANSCTIIATLIATIMFAASITIPGGTEGTNNTIPGGTKNTGGYPIFDKKPAFVVFALSDVVSLCTSVTCLSMFLALSISSHSLTNFWHTLPNILQSGLITLQISIAFMLISFSAAVCLVFGKEKPWVFILMIGMAYLIVLFFWWALLVPLLFRLVVANQKVKRFLLKTQHKTK